MGNFANTILRKNPNKTHNMKKTATAIAAALVGLAAFAQKTTVSPLPQSIQWGAEAYDGATATYKITGADEADTYAVEAIEGKLQVTGSGVEIVIGEKGDKAVEQYAAMIPGKAQGYYLKVEPGKVVIAGADEDGTYYGVQTFLQIAAQPKVMQATVTDYPDTPLRGIIEGYYGNPYTVADRESLYEFCGENKMNEYVYGPKDDEYHRAKWRTPYPAAEGEVIRALAEEARRHHVTFVWAVHPGGDIKWNKADSVNIVNKLETVYALGVRSFSVFFDDISGEGSKGDKQAGLLNYIWDEFVKKHDDIKGLSMCPTQYNRAWSGGSYLSDLGTIMYPEIHIMWTGNSVVDMINASDVTWISGQIKRKPYIWLNYPVTDYCINRMLMGKTYGNDPGIGNTLAAFLSNPMEYAEASKVSLYSIADYSWNTTKYDAEASWKRAIPYLMPTATDAFRVFCENNVDLGATYHGLRREGESPVFSKALAEFAKTMPTEDIAAIDLAATAKLRLQMDTLVWAADALEADAHNTALINELKPWLQKMRSEGMRGQLLMDMWADLKGNRPEDFIAKYKRVKELTAAEEELRSRDFKGSLKSATPMVGGEVIHPFLKQHLMQLVAAYKANHSAGWENFDAVLLETGNYYIMYNGQYLTDVNASPTRTGDYPEFKTALDDVNPMRCEWTISIDPATDRYKIVNAQDGRYINENGTFWANATNNPYDASWHTYNLLRQNGKYSIQNAGNAGSNYWTVGNGRIIKGNNNKTVRNSDFIFELVPVGGEANHPKVEERKAYYIMDSSGRALTSNAAATGNPTFQAVKTPQPNTQKFYFTKVESTGRYKITAQSATGKYLNELGNFGTNQFYDTWNTYVLTEMGGKWSIQNADEAKTNFWNVDGARISANITDREKSYIFTITDSGTVTEVALPHADQGKCLAIYDLQGRKVERAGKGIYIVNGEKVAIQ